MNEPPIDRATVRSLVRRELHKRLGERDSGHAALAEIYPGPGVRTELNETSLRRCVIEPEQSCVNTGYCKKLGY